MKARRRDGAHDVASPEHERSAGKRTRTQSLAAPAGRDNGAPSDLERAPGDTTAAASAGGAGGGAFAHDDPFGMHLIGEATSEPVDDGETPSTEDKTHDETDAAAAESSDDAEPSGSAESPGSDDDGQSDAGSEPAPDLGSTPGGDTEDEHGEPAGPAAGTSQAESHPPVAVDDAGPLPAAPVASASAEPSTVDAAQVQAGIIQSAAAAECQQALAAIAQREQMVRGTFAQQRAAIQNIGTTQAALARSEARTVVERIRGRNGTVATTIGQTIDGEVTRLSLATQDAMRRCTAASRVVTAAAGPAADGALANANLDFRDAVEGQLANDLYQRLIPPARKAVRDAAHDARDRDVNALATARDRNARALRNAGDMIARQVDAKLPELERSLLASGDKLAAVFERNARSQLTAIDASERAAAAFFTRARAGALQLLDAGRATANALGAAGAGQPAGAKLDAAAAHAKAQLSTRREGLVSEVDRVAHGASSAVSSGAAAFLSECTVQRGIAQGNYAALENKLTTEIAVKLMHVRAEIAKDIDLAIISGNSYAAAAEVNSAKAAAQLPGQFASTVRSAFAEARKSRLRRFGEGVWGALSGLAVALGKFVAASLIILFAPLAFGIAALLGKAGVLVGVLRDAVTMVVGMADAFAERFRVLFRTWDEWPWYGKVTGLWATTLLALGDVIGLPSIYEGTTGRELMSNRELSYNERGAKTFVGAISVGAEAVAVAKLGPKPGALDEVADASASRAGARDGGTVADDAAEVTAAKSGGTDIAAVTDDAVAVADDAAKATAVVLEGSDDIASYARAVPPKPGTLDVFVHGTVDEFIVIGDGGARQTLSHRSLATYIEKQGVTYERIRLISCKTGAHPKGAAQHLANKLNVIVEAPTDFLHINKLDGSMSIGPAPGVNTGRWEEFAPKQSEFRYSAAKDPAPETVHDRLRRRREDRVATATDPERFETHEPPSASADSKALGHETTPEPTRAADEVIDSADEGHRAAAGESARALEAASELPRQAEALQELLEIEVEYAPRGSSPTIEHDTYFVKPADGARIAELVRIVKPDLPVRAYRKGLLIGGGAEAWYFVFDERAGQLGGQRAAALSAADGGFGLPASNVATAELWAMRGAREIHAPGDAAPRKSTAWTPEEEAAVSQATAQQPLLETGHASVSADAGKTAYGWSPDLPEGTSFEKAKEQLGKHEAFPGVFKDDTKAFKAGERMADGVGLNTRPVRVPELLEKEQHQAMVDRMRQLEEGSPGSRDLAYSWPLRQPDAAGQHFAASNGFLAENVRNCAAFLEKLGLKLPEPSGNMKAFMAAIDEWIDPDAPIDARPKRGSR